MTSGRGERLRGLAREWRERPHRIAIPREVQIAGNLSGLVEAVRLATNRCADELDALAASLSEAPSQPPRVLDSNWHYDYAREKERLCQPPMPTVGSEDRSPMTPQPEILQTCYECGFAKCRCVLASAPQSAPIEWRCQECEAFNRDSRVCWRCSASAPAPVSKGESFRVIHVPHEAHKWVMEQDEIGEKTDHKRGLSEYRIDAAEQAFVAGWRASLFARGKRIP